MAYRILLCLLGLSFYGGAAIAQKWEFGGQAGASGYMGDLNPSNPVDFNDWMLGAFAKYNFNTTWGVRTNLQYLNIWAVDVNSTNPWFKERNLAFSSTLWELSAVAEFDFLKIIDCSRGRKYWQPYVFAGIGGTYFNPKRNYNGEWVSLRDLGTEGQGYRNLSGNDIEQERYGKLAMVIPFGAGLKYKPKGSWVFGLELGYRVTFTDYLDDVSGRYPNIANLDVPDKDLLKVLLLSDPSQTHLPGSMRGDGQPRDGYMQLSFRVSYILFNGGCPVW